LNDLLDNILFRAAGQVFVGSRSTGGDEYSTISLSGPLAAGQVFVGSRSAGGDDLNQTDVFINLFIRAAGQLFLGSRSTGGDERRRAGADRGGQHGQTAYCFHTFCVLLANMVRLFIVFILFVCYLCDCFSRTFDLRGLVAGANMVRLFLLFDLSTFATCMTAISRVYCVMIFYL
jgi:hypothetical protein